MTSESTSFTQEGTDAGQTGVRGFKFTMKSNSRKLNTATKVAGTTFPNCYLCAENDPTGASPLATAAFSGNVATFSPKPILAASTSYWILVQASSGATVSWDNTFSYPVSGTNLDFVGATNGGGGTQTNNGWALSAIDTEELTPPVAAFSGTPLSGTSPLSVAFTDASTNTPTSWLWQKNDGSGYVNFSSGHTSQNPTESLATGTWDIKLTATNADGSDAEEKLDYVVVTDPPAPTAAFSATPTSGTHFANIAFTDASTGTPTSWLWERSKNGTDNYETFSRSQNPTVRFEIGTWAVRLTATNAQGSSVETKYPYIKIADSYSQILDTGGPQTAAITNDDKYTHENPEGGGNDYKKTYGYVKHPRSF